MYRSAIGASLSGTKPIIVHPRMDFMLYAVDPIVNQAAKWSYMTGVMQTMRNNKIYYK